MEGKANNQKKTEKYWSKISKLKSYLYYPILIQKKSIVSPKYTLHHAVVCLFLTSLD